MSVTTQVSTCLVCEVGFYGLTVTSLVKKIKLRATQSDTKIFREVNALSRLNHRFIVRYYTTWFEESSPTATSSVNSETGTWVPGSRDRSHTGDSDPFGFDLDDLGSGSRHSFPSIRFTRSGTPESSSDEPESDDVFSDDPFAPEIPKLKVVRTPPRPAPTRTLYIQMVFSSSSAYLVSIYQLSVRNLWKDRPSKRYLRFRDPLSHCTHVTIANC